MASHYIIQEDSAAVSACGLQQYAGHYLSAGAHTSDKHNSDSAISFVHIYLQMTLSTINKIHDGKYCKLHTTSPLQNTVLNKV